MIEALATPIAEVQDMDRAVRFYRDVLGLPPEVVSTHWSSFKVGEGRLGLHLPYRADAGVPCGGWILGIETRDLVALRDRLHAHGVETAAFHNVPGGVVMDFSDPDGNRLEAIQFGVTVEQLT